MSVDKELIDFFTNPNSFVFDSVSLSPYQASYYGNSESNTKIETFIGTAKGGRRGQDLNAFITSTSTIRPIPTPKSQNELSLPEPTLLTNSLMNIILDDEYKSSLSWILNFESETGRFPPYAKYIVNLTSGSGIYINKKGVVVMDVTPDLIYFYIKFI